MCYHATRKEVFTMSQNRDLIRLLTCIYNAGGKDGVRFSTEILVNGLIFYWIEFRKWPELSNLIFVSQEKDWIVIATTAKEKMKGLYTIPEPPEDIRIHLQEEKAELS